MWWWIQIIFICMHGQEGSPLVNINMLTCWTKMGSIVNMTSFSLLAHVFYEDEVKRVHCRRSVMRFKDTCPRMAWELVATSCTRVWNHKWPVRQDFWMMSYLNDVIINPSKASQWFIICDFLTSRKPPGPPCRPLEPITEPFTPNIPQITPVQFGSKWRHTNEW